MIYKKKVISGYMHHGVCSVIIFAKIDIYQYEGQRCMKHYKECSLKIYAPQQAVDSVDRDFQQY
jgi:hypothetical protein